MTRLVVTMGLGNSHVERVEDACRCMGVSVALAEEAGRISLILSDVGGSERWPRFARRL
jgi:hypothetical protein